MSSRSSQPSSRVKLWIVFITDFLHLHYFLLGPICNVWRAVLQKPLSPNIETETRREKESLAADNSCTVNKTDFSILSISFWCLVYGHAQHICEAVIAMHYPESGSQREDYKSQPVFHYHSQSRETQESQTSTETQPRRHNMDTQRD